MSVSLAVAEKLKADHRAAVCKQALNSARARNLTEAEAAILAKAAADADWLVCQFDKYSAHFVGEDATVAMLALEDTDVAFVRGEIDGQPHVAVDRRDWNVALSRFEAQGHQVCHTDVPTVAA